MNHATFRAGDLTATIGDNAAAEGHRAGYNGIWSLRHATCPRPLFVPDVAGLNLEFLFDGQSDDSATEVFFEPRHAPMEFQRLSETQAQLHQPPTPVFGVESWTRFTLAPPHYLDMDFRCRLHKAPYPHGYLGLFWASYLHAPDDKSVHFLGGPDGQTERWWQLCSQVHNDESTVRHRDDLLDLTFSPTNRPALFRSLSPLRYDLPLFYGHFEEHVWIVMFDRCEGIRLAHSPMGGGYEPARQSANPAWDFQFVIADPQPGVEYGFALRTAFRPRCTRDEILAEYRHWTEAAPSPARSSPPLPRTTTRQRLGGTGEGIKG